MMHQENITMFYTVYIYTTVQMFVVGKIYLFILKEEE